MGRTTCESIGRPLPGRATIVLTRDVELDRTTACSVAHTRRGGARRSRGQQPGDLMVAGGGEVYAAPAAARHAPGAHRGRPRSGRGRPLPAVPGRRTGWRPPRGLRGLRPGVAGAVGPGRVNLTVDPASGVPPFEQVREGIRAQVESGALAPGFRLPPVRALAESLTSRPTPSPAPTRSSRRSASSRPGGGPARSSPGGASSRSRARSGLDLRVLGPRARALRRRGARRRTPCACGSRESSACRRPVGPDS